MEELLTPDEILNASNNAVLAAGCSGQIVYANQKVEEAFGLKRSEIIGKSVAEVMPELAPFLVRTARKGKTIFGLRLPALRGELIANISPVRKGKSIQGVLCSFQTREQLELSAQKLESYVCLNRQLNAVFESSSDGIWVCDSSGTVIRVNSASERLNAIKARDVVGKNVKALVREGLFDRSVSLEVLETKRQVSIVQHVKKTKKQLLVTGTPAVDENGDIYLVVVNERDMTQLNALEEQLQQSLEAAEKFKDELVQLSMQELEGQEIIAESEAMRRVLSMALRLSRFDASNILILGESGTGKGVVAKYIHKTGRRCKKPFVQINCAALPETLLEAELFGYEKGAYTGAREEGKLGLFELAHGGTLFLDEIGDLPFSVQAKLLKYLDDHEVMRLGSVKSRKVDCTVIAATNRDLDNLTKDGRFRRDLFFRLNTFTLNIPPLRERREDILPLMNYFLARHNNQYGQKKRIGSGGFEALQSWLYPGNVRELDNILKKAVLISDKEVLDDFIACSFEKSVATKEYQDHRSARGKGLLEGVRVLEQEFLREALKACKSTREMARHLRVSQPTVVRKMKKYKLSFSDSFLNQKK